MNKTIEFFPPHNLEAEESVISACLIDDNNVTEAIDLLSPEDFYKSAHQHIFRTMIEMYAENTPIDLVTIVAHLRKKDLLEKVGGAVYVNRIIDTAPYAVHLPHYAKIVLECSVRRQLIKKANDINRAAHESRDPIEEILEDSQQKVLNVDFKRKPEFTSLADMMEETVDRYEEVWNNKKLITGIPTGFNDIDMALSGLQKSDLIILAARPSMGKTALALQIAKGAAEMKHKTFVFSAEQPRAQLMDRLFAGETRMSTKVFRSGHWSRDDWLKVTEAAAHLNSLPMFIDDRGDQNYKEIRRTARMAHKKLGISLFIVDHLQLIGGAGNKSRNDEIGIYTRQFKAMAKELNVPVMVLSQLSRSLEQRTDKRPKLSDLRDSGNIEQDADVVMFIYRDEVYNQDEHNPNRGKAELLIAKQRQGPICMVNLVWLANNTAFYPSVNEGAHCEY